jgi:signal transduction histidine kinase
MRSTPFLRSSTFRLALMYMALFGISVLLLLAFIYWSTTGFMARQTDTTIEAEITGLAERYRLDGLTGLTALIAERIARKPTGLSVYLLTDSQFRPLVGNLNKWPDVPASANGWLDFRLEGIGWPKGETHWARAKGFRLRGGFQLLVGRDVQELEQTQRILVNTLLWGMAITVLLALVGGTMMTRTMMRRIELINDTSREIMSGDLSRRVPTRGTGDDFDQLAGNLNAMLDQIEDLMVGIRRVSDNIAHDLRTPLARLRNRLEVLYRKVEGSERRQELVAEAMADADGLLSTFAALLRIARVESSSAQAGFVELDLSELLGDVVEMYQPVAEEKGQELGATFPDSLPMRGDRDLLFQAVANLVDNAIKYTPVGGRIDVALTSDPRGWQIAVSDNGPGIPRDAREKVLQRFFRLESSRTTPGSGLGLSLVAAVAKLHRMPIRLEDNQPGLRVVLEMNVSDQA